MVAVKNSLADELEENRVANVKCAALILRVQRRDGKDGGCEDGGGGARRIQCLMDQRDAAPKVRIQGAAECVKQVLCIAQTDAALRDKVIFGGFKRRVLAVVRPGIASDVAQLGRLKEAGHGRIDNGLVVSLLRLRLNGIFPRHGGGGSLQRRRQAGLLRLLADVRHIRRLTKLHRRRQGLADLRQRKDVLGL